MNRHEAEQLLAYLAFLQGNALASDLREQLRECLSNSGATVFCIDVTFDCI